MHDRVAIVTGGGTGIGAATAVRLCADGFSVTICGRRREPLDDVATRLGAERVEVVVADLSVPTEAERVVERCLDRFGRLDVLVNNAGVYRPRPVVDETIESWRETFAINVEGPLVLCRAAHAPLAESKGTVINVLSTLAHRVAPGVAAYCASKAALLSLTRTLSLEWADAGIRVNAVSPGIVDTPIHGTDVTESLAHLQPLGRVGRPEEIAAAIAFLASEDSKWTTGANLDVDGGIQWR